MQQMPAVESEKGSQRNAGFDVSSAPSWNQAFDCCNSLQGNIGAAMIRIEVWGGGGG